MLATARPSCYKVLESRLEIGIFLLKLFTIAVVCTEFHIYYVFCRCTVYVADSYYLRNMLWLASSQP